MTKFNLSFIDAVGLPGDNAHSLQIENNINEFNKNFNFTLYSFKTSYGKLNCKHIGYEKKFTQSFLPYNVFTLLNKIKKIDFSDEVIYTRTPIIACNLSNRCKKVFLELHDIPKASDSFIHFILFKLFIDILPFNKIIKSDKIYFIVISKSLKNDLIKKGINAQRIHVAPDGINLEKFDIDISKVEARKKLSLPETKKLIIYTGSLQKWKGYDTLLNACTYLSDKSKLVIVGGSQIMIQKLKKIYPNVLFIGKVDYSLIPIYLKAADLLVIPNSGKYKISSHYTSPLKLFEYMAAKRPILASDLPSIKEIIDKGDALFFKPDSAEDLKIIINKFLKGNNYDISMVKNSYNKVKNYTWDNRIKNITSFIEKNV